LLVGPDRLPHVHVALIGVDLPEVVAAAPDVAEVDVDDLPAGAEPPDHVEDLFPGPLQQLTDGPLAEVEPVVRALPDPDEPLEALDRPDAALDALEPRGKPRYR